MGAACNGDLRSSQNSGKESARCFPASVELILTQQGVVHRPLKLPLCLANGSVKFYLIHVANHQQVYIT